MSLFGKKPSPDAEKVLAPLRKGKRYHRLHDLGEGGLARVSSTFDTHLNRVVAVKELKPSSLQNADLVRAFLTEAKLIGYLDHPGVISIFDTYIAEPEGPCYTMRLVEGASAAERYEVAPKPGETADRVNVFLKLCETLAYAHDKGVIHLDIKPDNIMVGRYGEVMLMDWGNARLHDPAPYHEYLKKFTDGSALDWFHQETEGMILGTPAYMSPEQASSARNTLGPSSDIFSTGIVFYEMLTGENPFIGEDQPETLRRIATLDPPAAHKVNPEVPRRLSQICAGMLAKDTAERYRSFHDILRDLREFQGSGQAFVTQSFAAGETIFKEGDPGEYAFSILSGRVEVHKTIEGNKRTLATLGGNEIVGEIAIFSPVPRTATVTAIEPTTIRIMARADVEKELEKLSPWVGEMITGLCSRFIGLNEKIISAGA